MQTVIETCNPKRLSASALVHGAAGGLMGIFVASASAAPTISVVDGLTAGGTTIVGTFTPVSGTFYPLPFFYSTGLFIVIAGTVDCTVAYGPVTA